MTMTMFCPSFVYQGRRSHLSTSPSPGCWVARPLGKSWVSQHRLYSGFLWQVCPHAKKCLTLCKQVWGREDAWTSMQLRRCQYITFNVHMYSCRLLPALTLARAAHWQMVRSQANACRSGIILNSHPPRLPEGLSCRSCIASLCFFRSSSALTCSAPCHSNKSQLISCPIITLALQLEALHYFFS